MHPTPNPQLIRQWLDDQGVQYRHVDHAPTRTSEESAAARGEPLANGAKALVLKIDEAYGLYVLSAARKLDSSALRRLLGVQRIRFATKKELLRLTGLVPGCVPPFGSPVLPLELALDQSVEKLDRVAFNAASLTESLVLDATDYLQVAEPTRVMEFSVGPTL